MLMRSIRTLHWSLFGCFTGVLLADWLFFRQPLGLNLTIFHLFLLGLAGLHIPLRLVKKPAIGILILLAGLLSALAIQPGPLVLCLTWLGLISFVFTSRQSWSSNPLEWLARWLHFAGALFLRIPRDLILIARWYACGHGGNLFERLAGTIRLWLLPAIGTILFFLLFLYANPVLAYWSGELEVNVLRFLNLLHPVRVFLWGAIAILLWTFVRARYRRRHFPEIGAGASLSDSILTRCLIVFNTIFAVQTALDVFYLWGGAALPASMSYAEYAHRGAYPLIVTALLAGGFVLATFRAGQSASHGKLNRMLVYIWLAQNILLIVNSLWRLHLYVETYSLTRLRLAAAIWMLLVSIGMLTILWRIYSGKSNQWLFGANFISLLAVLYICCFLNFDGFIAWYNVRNCKEVTGSGAGLDVRYLEHLGPESIAPLYWYRRNMIDDTKGMEAYFAGERLGEELQRRAQNWKAWTLRRHLLHKQLSQQRFASGLFSEENYD